MANNVQSRYRTSTGADLFMTAEQAERWNDGMFTESDMEDVIALIPTESQGLPTHEEVCLADCEGLYNDWYRMRIEDRQVHRVESEG